MRGRDRTSPPSPAKAGDPAFPERLLAAQGSVEALADSVRSPRVRYDYVISRIPITVLVDPGVKAVSVPNIHLCELNWTICRNFHGIGASTRQLFVRLDFSRRQAACAHANHLVVAHFCDNRIVTDLSNLVFSILMEFWPQKAVTVVVMGIFGQRECRGH